MRNITARNEQICGRHPFAKGFSPTPSSQNFLAGGKIPAPALVTGSKLLIHACCAPCLSAPANYFSEKGWQATALFFNPNIHPFTEYAKRRDCLVNFCQQIKLPLFLLDEYRLEEFLQRVTFKEKQRCNFCYSWRLQETARYAKENDFPYFTTTLLISPHQQHEVIKEAGRAAGQQFGVEFLSEDLRFLWPDRHKLTRQYQLYRQQYCGCIYSEKDRYAVQEKK